MARGRRVVRGYESKTGPTERRNRVVFFSFLNPSRFYAFREFRPRKRFVANRRAKNEPSPRRKPYNSAASAAIVVREIAQYGLLRVDIAPRRETSDSTAAAVSTSDNYNVV